MHVKTSIENELVIGRTMELGDAELMRLWRGWTRPATETTFGALFLGVKLGDVDFIAEGMNEFGLTMSAHTFHMAEYQSMDASLTNVMFPELIPYVLAKYRSVQQAVEGLRTIRVTNPIPGKNDAEFLHWGLQDALGDSVVIEYVKGELRVHDNHLVGVMTNDPEFEFHLKYLNVFAGITNQFHPFVNPSSSNLPAWTNHGANLVGLPGDLSPPSRFVRTYVLKQLAKPPRTVADGFALINQLLNAVAIPYGAVGPMGRKDHTYELTQWSTIRIPTQKWLFFRTYRHGTWKKVDLAQMGLSLHHPPQSFTLHQGLGDDMIDAVDVQFDHPENLRAF